MAGAGISNAAGQLKLLTLDTAAALQARGKTSTSVVTLRGLASVGDGQGGMFVLVPTDTTSADNGLTILVDAAGRRWYRAAMTVAATDSSFPALGASNAGWPSINAKGPGATVHLAMRAKGSGSILILTNDVAANYLQVWPANAGGAVRMQIAGTDANVNLALYAKGSGRVNIVTDTASNYVSIGASNAGAWPSVQVLGTDTNIGLTYSAKGAGAHLFNNGQANYFLLQPSAATNAPVIQVSGTDANIDLIAKTKGSGRLTVTSDTSANYLQLMPAAAGNNVGIVAAGSDANISVTHFCQGSGAFNFASPTLANYLVLQPAATGVGPNMQVQGSDVNINFTLYAKGSGAFSFANGQANYLSIGPAAAGSGVSISTQGSDASVDMLLYPKGTASQLKVQGGAGGLPSFAVEQPAAAAVAYVATRGVSSGAPEVAARGTATDIDLILSPKGAGVLGVGSFQTAANGNNFTAVKMLPVKDSVTGTTYYIPARATPW